MPPPECALLLRPYASALGLNRYCPFPIAPSTSAQCQSRPVALWSHEPTQTCSHELSPHSGHGFPRVSPSRECPHRTHRSLANRVACRCVCHFSRTVWNATVAKIANNRFAISPGHQTNHVPGPMNPRASDTGPGIAMGVPMARVPTHRTGHPKMSSLTYVPR